MTAAKGRKHAFRILIGIGAAVMVTSTWAQCATGVNTGGGNCVPPDAPGMPGYDPAQGNAPPTPSPVWKDTWGAIVIDSATGGAGTVTDRDTKSDAIRDATRDCESRGATGCKVEMTYYNQCAAVAWGVGGHGIARGPDKSKAEDDAMLSCDESASQCKVVYSGCSLARRVQ